MRTVFTISIFITLLFSCKKAEDRSCFKSIGEEAVLDVPVSNFTELYLLQNLNYTLVADTTPFIRLKGGRNLLNFISADVQDGILSIENKNRCNFLRKYDRLVDVEIHYVQLNRVDYRGSHDLSSLDTIFGDFFNLRFAGSSGNAYLLVNTNFINGFVNDGSGDYYFTGKTNVAHIQAYHNGFADVRNLDVSESLEITTRSSRRVLCHADGIPLKVTISGTGDVQYTGTPSGIELIRTGSGNLVKID
jgi:Ca2+-binding RTX toxin-like protein